MKRRDFAATVSLVVCLAVAFPRDALAQIQGSFCDQTSTLGQPEKLICENYALQALDRSLNEHFQSAMFFSRNDAMVRAGQRDWLLNERNKCSSTTCLESTYRARIGKLQQQIAASIPPSGARIDGSNVETVCKEVLALADRKMLGKHSIPALPFASSTGTKSGVFLLPLARGKPLVQFSSVSTGGSCWSSELRNDSLEKAGLETRMEVDDAEDRLRWSWWGAGDYPANIKGRFFALTSRGDPNLLTLISWVRPDGRIQALCSVEQSLDKVLSKKSTDQVCRKLESNTGETPDWTEATEELAALEKPPFGTADTPTARVTSVVLGTGRKKHELAKFSIDSGAGCGLHAEWLRVVDTVRPSLINNDLDKALSKIGHGSEIDLTKVSGDFYVTLLDRTKQGAAYRIAKGGLKKVCEYTWSSSSRISRVW